MALVLYFRSACIVGCIICGLLVVSLSGNYQTQQQNDRVQQQLQQELEEQSQQQQQQQHNNRDGQQRQDIIEKSQSDPSPSVPHTLSSPPRVSATDTKRTVKPGVSSTDSVQEITEVNRDSADYFVDDGAENVDVVYVSNKRQPMTERDDKSSSISPENVEDRNELENEESQLRKISGSNNVDSLKNKLNPDGIEVIFPSKEEYLHRYYGINRKERPNNNQERKLRKKQQKQDEVTSSLGATNPKTGSASLSSKTPAASSSSYGDAINAKVEEIIENKRQEELYVFDKQHIDDEEIDDYAEDDEYDEMSYAENISKYNGGRVKRRVVRGRDEWASEDDRSIDYAAYDSRERSKDRHGGGRGRGRTAARGRGSNPNGYDRSTQEMDPDIDASNYEPEPAEYRAGPTSRRRSGNGKGGGGGRRTEGGGGDGRGRRAGQDRRYGNRHHDLDGSERGGYSNRDDGYTGGERSHSESSSPPSRHSDSYGRYSENPTGTRNSKSSSSDKTCHICAMKKMDREIRLRALKAQIIKQIGLNELPNITKNDRIMSKVPALKYIIENMTMQRDEPSWRDSPGEKSLDITEQMIITAEKPTHLISHFGYNLSGLCYFNVSGRLKTSVIKEATLWLYLRPQSKVRRSMVEVRIWDAVDRVVHPDPLKVLKVEIGRFGEWAHVKATTIIKQWVKNTRLNYGLNITATDSYGNNRIWTPDIPNHAEDYPVMDIKFSPRRHSRHRRTVGQMCTDEEHTGRCCLYPLMVDFLEMKWYWVIYPHNFEANYCSGNCSLEIIDDTLPYAYIGFKSASTIDGVRCCTSTREGELQILYYTDANKIIHTQLEDIVVKECGCR